MYVLKMTHSRGARVHACRTTRLVHKSGAPLLCWMVYLHTEWRSSIASASASLALAHCNALQKPKHQGLKFILGRGLARLAIPSAGCLRAMTRSMTDLCLAPMKVYWELCRTQPYRWVISSYVPPKEMRAPPRRGSSWLWHRRAPHGELARDSQHVTQRQRV